MNSLVSAYVGNGKQKCDVIYEKAYGRANRVFLDKHFPYIYIHVLFLKCAQNEKKCVYIYSYVTKVTGSS